MNQRKAGLTILISDKVDVRAKKITKGREEHYIMIKGPIYQEDSNPKYGCTKQHTKYVKQILIEMKGEIDKFRITVGDFNTPLSKLMKQLDRKQQGNNKTQQHCQLTGLKRHLKNTPSNNRTHTLFSDPWNIYPDKSCPVP